MAVRVWPCLIIVLAKNWAKDPNPTMPIFMPIFCNDDDELEGDVAFFLFLFCGVVAFSG